MSTAHEYVRLREVLHRAEEGLLLTWPVHRVVAAAADDELRLTGSTIENRDSLLRLLRIGIELLVRRAPPLNFPLTVPTLVTFAAPAVASAIDERLGRHLIQNVRRSINQFRDERRLGLIRARNQLLRTIFLTGLLAYALLALAIRRGVDRQAIVAAGAVFMIGAVIGLFNRLYLDGEANAAIEDYGLSVARLVHTPLLSGLAAVAGVALIPLLSVMVSSDSTANAQVTLPALTDVFNLSVRPYGVVLAAIFGLSPVTLITRLQKESEQYKSDLKQSETP